MKDAPVRRGWRAPLLVLGVLVASCLPARDARAATFVVNSTVDAVDAAPGNGVCATAASTCTLRAAVQEANALGGSHTVSLPAATYALTIPASSPDSDATGDLNVAAATNLTIAGAGASTTIVDANGLYPVFTTFRGRLQMSDVTVRNGAGCFFVFSGHLALTRSVVTSCGGTGVTIEGFPELSTLAVTDTVVTQNIAADGVGGGLYVGLGTDATVTGSTVSNNASASGAGMFIRGAAGPNATSRLALTQSRLENNTATQNGGGISADGAIFVTITESVIGGNSASSGGGIYATGFDDEVAARAFVRVQQSAVVQNDAIGTGGGAGLYVGPPVFSSGGDARVQLVNATISGNDATVSGGGAVRTAERGTVSLTNVTIAGNTSAAGAAIDGAPASLQIGNTIVAGNGVNCALSSPVTDLGSNLEFPATSCGLTLPSDRHADPLLAPLGSYGGRTPTHALPRTSPAVDGGDASLCSGGTVSNRDQRGFTRVAPCDIGAYEVAALPPPFTDASLTVRETVVRAVHVVELRGRIDAQRARFNLSPLTWTDANPAGVVIQAVHIQQMRDALTAAYTAAAAGGISVSPPSFTDSPLSGGQTIKAVHVEELRSAVLVLEAR